MRDTKIKKNNNNLNIIKSDKTKKTVIMENEDYDIKIKTLLDNKNTYRKIRHGPSKTTYNIEKYINKLIKHGYIKTKLLNPNYNNARIHGIVKLHKPNTPLRPIINNINGITERLSTFLNPSMNYLNNDNNYDVKNAIEVKRIIEDIQKIDSKSSLVSFDVENLFTNINEVIKNN